MVRLEPRTIGMQSRSIVTEPIGRLESGNHPILLHLLGEADIEYIIRLMHIQSTRDVYCVPMSVVLSMVLSGYVA